MGTTQTKCVAGVPPTITCATGFFGAPKEKTKALIGVDFRLIGEAPLLGIPIGIDPGFTYDAVAGSEAVQIPIYLFTDSSKNLSGGIRYDWTSTKHVSVVGVFASAALDILQ